MAKYPLAQLLENVREIVGTTKAGLLAQLSDFKNCDFSRQGIDHWYKGAPKLSRSFSALCALRKISKLSWADYGKMLDKLFLGDEKK